VHASAEVLPTFVLRVPGSHSVHALALGPLHVPVPHRTHVVKGETLKKPAAQSRHTELLANGAYLPPAHGTQAATDAPRASLLAVPAGHAKHLPALPVAYVPAPHSWHTLEPTKLYVPTSQNVHTDAPEALYLPAEHCVHESPDVLPGMELYVPAAHSVQPPAAEMPLYEPAGHVSHVDARAALY
jgi:hypothetical protein